MKRIGYFLIIAFLFLLNSCNTNVIDETKSTGNENLGENNFTEVEAKVLVDGIINNDPNLKLVSIADELPLSESDELTVVYNDLPQLLYVSDNSDNIYMLGRVPITKNTEVIINEETTAIALASMNPLFTNIKSDEFSRVEQMIKSTDSYPKYLEEVKKAIQNRNDIFDVNNTELLINLNNVWEDLCYSVPDEVDNTRAIFTRATNIKGINPDPISVETNGVDVIVRNKGLIPTYECEVYHGANLVYTKLVQSHNQYGFLDLFSGTQDLKYGEPVEFNLNKYGEGEYRFYFDRTTDRAINDFSRRLWSDVLSMIGLYNVGNVADNSVAAIGAIASALANPSGCDWADVTKAISLAVVNIGIGMKWEAFGAVLTKFNVVYNVLKGFTNEMVRSVLGFTAPHFIDFCLCSYNYTITTCTESEITKKSGDEQKGFSGQRLLDPLVVETKVFADDGSEIERSTYQKVKFEVISGGGKVSKEIVGTEAGTKEASTYWTLGEEGDQKVKAVVVDMVTGVEVSQPVYFTAELRENADLTVRLDWAKLSGDTDIDLHVTDPYGDEVAFYNPTVPSGGWLDRDDVVGPGPEHITWSEAPSGAYLIQVHYYGSESHAITSYTVTIRANGQDYGPFNGSIAYNQLITIGVLNLPSGTFTRSNDSSKPVFNEMFDIKENVVYPKKK